MALTWALWLLFSISASPALSDVELADYVLPHTGDAGGGNTFPGVTRPFGMAKLGPDLYTGSDAYSGYAPSGVVTGFSMLHESGTGGAPKYGVVAQMPAVGPVGDPLASQSDGRAAPDVAELGYYKASLESGITVELAASERAGLYQYTFPSSAAQSSIIVDVGHVLLSSRGLGWSQSYLGGSLAVDRDDGKTRYQGYGSYDGGWNLAPKWTVYFCGYFDSEPSWKTFISDSADIGGSVVQYSADPNVTSTNRVGAVFSFNSTTAVSSRVGVSFISTEKACRNVNGQIPDGTRLSSLKAATRDSWTSEILSKITTTETNTTKLQLLYTSLYHMNILPTNKTGENPLWTSPEPYYDDTFTLWDRFRCAEPLAQLLAPEAHEEYIRSLIDIYKNEGYMPDARSSFYNGAVQGGSNADNILADAYVKGVRGQINWHDGYDAMVKNAEVTPPNNNDPRDTSSSTKEGRGALPDWKDHGYITPTYGRSVSRAVEYAANDFALYQVAKGLDKLTDAAKYLNRARFWRNHWNPNVTSLGFSGFVMPRDANGFIEQDPLSCGGCYWRDYFYEALPWEYSFADYHDADVLIALCGGEDTFAERLGTLFQPGKNPASSTGESAFNYTIFNPGNEPSFTSPYLFNFVGRQHLSVEHSRYVADAYYAPTETGLPGNSDAGAMESWLLWNMIGLYPVTGQTTFLVGSPWFADTTLRLGAGRALRITATAAAGGEPGGSAHYVQSLRVNGRPWHRAWVSYADVFEHGGTMEFVLGDTPVLWDTGEAPPSPASEFARDASVADIMASLPTPGGLA